MGLYDQILCSLLACGLGLLVGSLLRVVKIGRVPAYAIVSISAAVAVAVSLHFLGFRRQPETVLGGAITGVVGGAIGLWIDRRRTTSSPA